MGTILRIFTTYAEQITSADNDRAGVKGRKAKPWKSDEAWGQEGRCWKCSVAYAISH